jgi:hypothetical protein
VVVEHSDSTVSMTRLERATRYDRPGQVSRKDGTMTLRHVVMWKVAGDTDEERAAVTAEFRDRLLALPSQIDVIRSFEVGVNDAGGVDNYDVVLVSEFDDEDALQAYITHPVHQEVVAFVRANTVGRAGVDHTI